MAPAFKLNAEAVTARVLGTDQDGNPAFTLAPYGKGKVFFLKYPMEKSLFYEAGVFNRKNAEPYWKIYHHIKNSIPTDKVVSGNNPMIGITEHIANENTRIVVAVNYNPEVANMTCKLENG